MQKRTDVDENGREIEDLADELTTLDLNVMEEPFEGKLAEGCDLCGENGQALCWHKVEDKFEFVFRVGYVFGVMFFTLRMFSPCYYQLKRS